MEAVYECYAVQKEAEISIESNPGTLDEKKLKSYKAVGVNRISIGLQSSDDEMLRKTGRIHTYKDFLENYNLARKTGFENINIDYMSALPGQTLKSYEDSIKKILLLEPEHISAYSLIIEPETPFYKKYAQDVVLREKGETPLYLPDEDLEYDMTKTTKELLEKCGYAHYEISNYAKKGYECKHNLGYWTRKEYLGFGLGAASLYQNIRFSNARDLKQYINMEFKAISDKVSVEYLCKSLKEQSHKEVIQLLDKQTQMEEFMFLGLRMLRGISKEAFRSVFDNSVDEVYGIQILKLKQEGLLDENNAYVFPTEYGIDLNNYVCASFLR